MLKQLWDRLIIPINPAGMVLLGMYTFLWGFWLANPWWQVFTEADLYSRMHELAPEWAWGLTAMVASLAILYGALRPSYRTLIIGSLVGTWHWGLSSLMYFMGNWQNTGGITSFFIAVYAFYIYINVRVNKIGSDGHIVDADY